MMNQINEAQKVVETDQSLQLSIERTILSNTRTYSAWVRTGLSLVLAGFGIVKFLGNNDDYQAFVSLIGILFVLLGIAVYIYAYKSYKQSYMNLEKENERRIALLKPTLFLTTGLVVTAVFVIALLILFR